MLHVADVELVKEGKPILHDLNIQAGEAERVPEASPIG